MRDRIRNLPGDTGQDVRVPRAQIDHHRLSPADHVPDHVAQELMGVIGQPRDSGIDFFPDLGHHGPDRRPLGRRNQLDEEITAVGHDKVAAQAGSGAARVGIHVRIFLEDRLDIREFPIGLDERRAGRRLIIQHETAFVHLRQETRADVPLAEITDSGDGGEDDDGQPWPREESAEQAPMETPHPVLLVVRRIVPLLEVDQPAGHQRHQQGREAVGDDQGRRHRDRQELEERPGHPGEERQRDEHDDGGAAGPRQGRQELPRRAEHGPVRLIQSRDARTTRDLLNHDDSVVDQQTDSGGDAAEGHDVERHPECATAAHRWSARTWAR